MRIAVLLKSRCKPKICDHLCIRVCPINRAGDECIAKGEDTKPVISEVLCVGCGICVNKCPFGAIIITNLPEEAGILTHQYGVNGFRMYGLPIPKSACVVGLLGQNGTGKSTALKILSGQLLPNLGGDAKSLDEVIEKYRGNEVQAFLETMKAKSLKCVMKPQYVDKIREHVNGTVKGVLRGADPKIIERLELGSCLDRKVEQLSGGELQRLAIAVALSKDADFYFFDEPCSYLDIRQRLKVAKLIRELAQSKSVLVVEHDLVVLDYLSDYVHITYGMPSAFGIVSQIKGTRVGINEYVAGWMKNENVRFKSEEISFEEKALSRFEGNDPLCTYCQIGKSYKGFRLDVDAGKLMEGEVVGIVGANATGKTTFVKILAGIEKNDLEDVDLGVSVSYKPQYLEPSDATVRETLTKVKKDIHTSHYTRNVLVPLMLDQLLDKPLKELSGGELQRAAIAECLSRDADIYLLDEPSAYLDVEQRLVSARLLRKWMEEKGKTALVVDHDIAFIDYLSDRLMVFEGEPGVNGKASAPLDMRAGMNLFLKGMGITFRRDKDTKRPRANKPDSQLDKEQKGKGEYYYS